MTGDDEKQFAVAALRYRIIAEAAESKGGGVTMAVQIAAGQEHRDLDGRPLCVKERTLWRWLAAFREGGLLALMPKRRSEAGQLRAFERKLLDTAAGLRLAQPDRATKTLIDILEREKLCASGAVKRSTLDRHLDHLGVSRRRLHSLGERPFGKVKTETPLELVIADFHHGPYVRLGEIDRARRALLLAFIDHFSRDILHGRYYLHEDFVVLRVGFRHVLILFGLIGKLYVDNGPSFQARRFQAACANELLDIKLVYSKAYVSEGRGCCERFNRTVKEQFESEVRHRDELLTLDELNAYFEAWLAERYRRDIHSETGEAPAERFAQNATFRPAPDLAQVDDLLHLRQRAKVHKKWSSVQVKGVRYLVDPALRAPTTASQRSG